MNEYDQLSGYEQLYNQLRSACVDFFSYGQYSHERADAYAEICEHMAGRKVKEFSGLEQPPAPLSQLVKDHGHELMAEQQAEQESYRRGG